MMHGQQNVKALVFVTKVKNHSLTWKSDVAERRLYSYAMANAEFWGQVGWTFWCHRSGYQPSVTYSREQDSFWLGPSGMCGELVTLGQVLLWVLWFSPVNDTYYSTDAIFSFICYPYYEEWAVKKPHFHKNNITPHIKDSKFQVVTKKIVALNVYVSPKVF